jgi:DNA-binding NarL/FixJ family response regulator
MSVRVAIIEDDRHYRGSLEELIRHAPGTALAGSFGTAETALRFAQEQARREGAPAWDLVLTDIELPGMSGIEATRRLKALHPDVKIVALTVFEEPATILEAICAGADGYLLKKARAKELLAAIETVLEGGAPLTAKVAHRLLDLVRETPPARAAEPAPEAPSRLELTEREQQVLRELVEGRTYKEIGDALGIGLGTVRTHITAIYRKLQVHSVAAAVRRAIRERIL